MYKDIPDAPWIGNDDYGKEQEYTREDYEYDHQDDERGWQDYLDHIDEMRGEDEDE